MRERIARTKVPKLSLLYGEHAGVLWPIRALFCSRSSVSKDNRERCGN